MATDALPEPDAARPGEWEEALGLLFRHCPAGERPGRVARGLAMLGKGELDPSGLLVLRGDRVLLGAVVGTVVPGGTGLVWPPQAVGGPRQSLYEDVLARHVTDRLRRQGARLGQCLLAPEEAFLAAPLLRNGFRHVTALWYLRHDNLRSCRKLSSLRLEAPARLVFQTYEEADRDLFHRTLLRTYEGTLDCPEVAGIRTLDEVLTGHKAQGQFNPSLWWLALDGGRPVGVLLAAAVADPPGWEVAYVGVVPEERRRGRGRELMLSVLMEARAAAVPELILTVDGRNRPAWHLYRTLGFEVFDKREVFLAFWDDCTGPAGGGGG